MILSSVTKKETSGDHINFSGVQSDQSHCFRHSFMIFDKKKLITTKNKTSRFPSMRYITFHLEYFTKTKTDLLWKFIMRKSYILHLKVTRNIQHSFLNAVIHVLSCMLQSKNPVDF